MQCHEMRISGLPLLGAGKDSKPAKAEKEVIHSGHFMVSQFEAEAQDDEYEVAVPVPEIKLSDSNAPATSELQVFNVSKTCPTTPLGQLAIETSLTKLFQCMSLAYRQKLTSPKWNRFKGIRLRWKDKIRLNNVIWRCWHMQFIKKENTLICQFASPLDEGTHNKPEAVVLEGKYWKRKLAAVTAEYKKWRMFYRNRIMGWACKDSPVADVFEWQTPSTEVSQLGPMMMDEDYMELMSDTLFSTISSNQPFAFPDTREIARGANLADFIQPSLVQLQPNLEDFMDTFEPLQGLFTSKLPPVPEDCAVTDMTCRPEQSYMELDASNQASIAQAANQPLGCRTISQPAPDYESVINYTESLPSKPISPDELKTARFYHSKPKPQQVPYPSRIPAVATNQGFTNVEDCDKSTLASVGNQPFSFEGDNSKTLDRRNGLSSEITGAEQTFKVPVTSPKIQQPYKTYQYSKINPQFSTAQYSRLQGNYDLDPSSECLAMPDVSLNTEKNLAFKGRQRTRSGSSLNPVKPRPLPSPLTSANSDTALNIPGALLAQLLTSNNPGMHNIQQATDMFFSTQSVVKSSNLPILPALLKTPQQNKILPKPSQSALIINPAVNSSQNLVHPIRPVSSPDSPRDSSHVQHVPSPTLSQSPTSPLMFPGPVSPSKMSKFDVAKPCSGINEHRRVCHINAEQKRRYNIKNGFDVLYSLIPHLHQNPNLKLSKAAMLQKGADYIRQLQAERIQAKEDMEGLKYQIESLSASISNCQSLLPATGAPVSRHRTTKMKEMFDEYVRARTMENWKFWIFSILFEPLLQSFSCSVSTASYDDMYRSTLIWVEQHCSLVDLRPAVFNSLRNLCTSTEILSDPSKLPEEARAAVNRKRM